MSPTARDGILALLEALTDQPASALSATDRLVEDLGMDSVDAVQLLALVSERFGVDLPIDAIAGVRTVGDVITLAERHARVG